MTHIDTLNAIMDTRHSCRAFRPDPVDRATIETIVATAQKVPSWCNAQPWQVTSASGAAADRFREALYAHVMTATPAPICRAKARVLAI